MDCCDDDPVKVWVVVLGWSYRRAILTHAAPFLAASDYTDPYALEGMTFMARMDLGNPPPFDHEAGERIEFPELKMAPPMAKVYEDFGMSAPDEPEERRTTFHPDFASTNLRGWLSALTGDVQGITTQVFTEADGLCYLVNGARYDSRLGVELLLDPIGFFRKEDDELEGEGDDDEEEWDVAFDFGLAARSAVSAGCRIARQGWMESGLSLRYDPASEQMIFCSPDGDRPWIPLQVDVLAKDWIEIEDED
jgi:hypothetical protein